MKSAWFESGLLGIALAALSPAATSAQPVATSLQQLQSLGSDRTVTLTDASGRTFRGTIADVSEAWLCMQIGREWRCFEATDVDSVQARKEDSLANGALIGAAVGSGLTSLIFLDNECRDDPSCYAAVALYGGIGAAAGLIVDAFIHRSLVVYAAPSRRGAQLSVGPMGLRGVRLTVVF
ncbi:hypothetical protein LuPra_01915 [Luteitalea pratensis]|uniref:Uncharacterized protein n=1 Tax=Luteitalea pratensis TaxID=1855912 RepID=A0A143PJN7_LUTPR|nr:hypothetical protein [Luteitalea pratensis]AMY08711.1 hypothetical protein LuPra_01915 [Luteitalea pratensis]